MSWDCLVGVQLCLVMYWGGLGVPGDCLEGGKGIYCSCLDIFKEGFLLHSCNFGTIWDVCGRCLDMCGGVWVCEGCLGVSWEMCWGCQDV